MYVKMTLKEKFKNDPVEVLAHTFIIVVVSIVALAWMYAGIVYFIS